MSELWDIEEIVLRAQRGDETAFEELVKKYEKLIYYIAIQRVGNVADAMDIVQETLIEVKKSISQLKEPRFFKAWLNKIVYSKISRYYEKRKDLSMSHNEEQTLYKQKETRYYMDPQRSFQYQNNKDILAICLHELKDIYREVLELQYFEGYSMAEIAQLLQIPEGTVKSRLNVAKKELRRIIEQMEKEEKITLDFNSVGIEMLLLMAYGSEYNRNIGNDIGESQSKQQRFLNRIQTHPLLASVLVLMISIGGIAGASAIVNSMEDHSDLNREETIPVVHDTKPFPVVIYQGTRIPNAREAYIALYKAAFEDKNSISEEISHLYEVLIAYGGEYADMAMYIKEYLPLEN